MVTRGGWVCAMVVVAILSSDGTGGRTGRAGGQHCDESGGNRLLSGHACPVGAAGGGRDAEPTTLTAGTNAGGRRGQAQVATRTSVARHGPGRQIKIKARAGGSWGQARHRDHATTAWRPWHGSTGRNPGTEPSESRVRPTPRPPPESSQRESASTGAALRDARMAGRPPRGWSHPRAVAGHSSRSRAPSWW
jgi:hypothetical protein